MTCTDGGPVNNMSSSTTSPTVVFSGDEHLGPCTVRVDQWFEGHGAWCSCCGRWLLYGGDRSDAYLAALEHIEVYGGVAHDHTIEVAAADGATAYYRMTSDDMPAQRGLPGVSDHAERQERKATT